MEVGSAAGSTSDAGVCRGEQLLGEEMSSGWTGTAATTTVSSWAGVELGRAEVSQATMTASRDRRCTMVSRSDSNARPAAIPTCRIVTDEEAPVDSVVDGVCSGLCAVDMWVSKEKRVF